MEKGKFIIPIASLLVLGLIIGTIVFVNRPQKNFNIPGRYAVESEIENLGYDVGDINFEKFKAIGINSDYEKIWAKYNDKEKNETRDVSISFTVYDSISEAEKYFNDVYASARYLEKKSDYKGNVKEYFDTNNSKGYVLYNFHVISDNLVENYALSMTDEDNLFQPKSKYLYGGVYLEGKRIVYFTTSNPAKKDIIDGLLDKYGLPKP